MITNSTNDKQGRNEQKVNKVAETKVSNGTVVYSDDEQGAYHIEQDGEDEDDREAVYSKSA